MQTAIIGKIEEIQELQLKGANKDFKVQNVIVEVDCSYKNANGETVTASQPIKVEFKQKNTENYDKAGKIYVPISEKIIETFLSIFDFIKLLFVKEINYDNHINHSILEEEINLHERI